MVNVENDKNVVDVVIDNVVEKFRTSVGNIYNEQKVCRRWCRRNGKFHSKQNKTLFSTIQSNLTRLKDLNVDQTERIMKVA